MMNYNNSKAIMVTIGCWKYPNTANDDCGEYYDVDDSNDEMAKRKRISDGICLRVALEPLCLYALCFFELHYLPLFHVTLSSDAVYLPRKKKYVIKWI